MEHNLCGSSWRQRFVKCECVCLCHENAHRSGTQQDFTLYVCQKLTNGRQPDRQTQLDTDRHATATPLCGPTRYDLHLQYREEEEEEGEEKESWTEGEWRGQERLLYVCSELACFSVVLNFDRLRLLLGSVSLLSRGQGRRDNTPSLGKGAGARGSEGWGGVCG